MVILPTAGIYSEAYTQKSEHIYNLAAESSLSVLVGDDRDDASSCGHTPEFNSAIDVSAATASSGQTPEFNSAIPEVDVSTATALYKKECHSLTENTFILSPNV